MKRLALLPLLVLALAACGGGSSSGEMVWCVGPDEVVDAKFKREYPDLYISKAACDMLNEATE